ncbi:alanine--tRNA ligase [Patescibacteria group bacterium]|nr:alanine--tRNA ligase [Patescibacteria group bacterium]
MTSDEIRSRYLEFFKKRGHIIIPSASLVPENDPTTLFTGSGMQPMIPYLLGQTHPLGTRITDSQKSFRSGDIEDVGDNRHTTFFEMLGNWSFGDYFQEEQLTWIFQFLTDEIKLDPKKLFVTVFGGDKENNLARDTKAVEIWQKLFRDSGIEAKEIDLDTEENGAELGMQGGRIFYYGSKKNWWSRSGVPDKMPVGEPGGPDSEMFYEFDEIVHDLKFGKLCHPNCDCGRYMEIGNNVFMQFVKVEDKKFEYLPNKNIDFGGGFERIVAATLNTADIFNIDILKGTVEALEKLSKKSYSNPDFTASFRVVADHLRSSIFLIGDGVIPGNSDQGYYVRRLLRRAVRYWDKLGIEEGGLSLLVDSILEYYKNAYPDTVAKSEMIKEEIRKEEEKFRKTLKDGLKQFERIIRVSINGNESKMLPVSAIFELVTSYGFPFEIVKEEAKERGLEIDELGYQAKTKEHRELSRAGAEKKFKGGLGDTSEMSLKYHTATHLLNAALKQVLGDHVSQKGSNITPERLRFDFTHPQKMSDDEKKKVEDSVNENIQKALPVSCTEMPKEEAEKVAVHSFGDKYGAVVKVYSIGNDQTGYISREFCGGPHVENTSVLGTFKIQKEEAVSQGVRRIKAVLE